MGQSTEILETVQMLKTFIDQRIEMGEESWVAKGLSEEPELKGPESLERFYDLIKDCQRCGLAQSRTNLVFGEGREDAGVMFIGEAPGRDEDLQGKPFVGRCGQLLTKIVESIKMSREDVYIANILKCRPPENRDPLPDEIGHCEPYLKQQIELINPRIICALGRIAAQTLLKTTASLSALRGKLHSYQGIKLIVTYHPAALLRNPHYKRPTWEDMKFLRKEYDGVVIT